MNEQEKARRFSAHVDRFLHLPVSKEAEHPLPESDQPTLELARTMAALDFSPRSRFLRQVRQQKGDKRMSISHNRRRTFVALGAALMLGLIALVAIQPARAFATELLQSLFIRNESDRLPVADPVAVSDEPTATAVPVEPSPAMSIAEADALAPFAVREPGLIPNGFVLTSVHYNVERERVTLLYLNDAQIGFSLHQEPAGYSEPGTIGPDATIEPVFIGEIPGEYVRGTWVLNDDTSPGDEMVWDDDDPYRQLRWVQDGIAYTLGTTVSQDTGLMRGDLIAIAESLQ